MIEFGKSLRTAREARGLSLSQLADSTHILSQIVEGLENEDFSKIVAPIYGRGFVKLYCEAVGLEPQPFIEQFMKLYNGTAAKDATPVSTPSAAAIEANPAETKPIEELKFPFPLNPRMLAVAISAAVVLLLLVLGLRALYHATAADPFEPATVEAAVETVGEQTAAEAAEPPATPTTSAPRQQLPVKPFYAD